MNSLPQFKSWLTQKGFSESTVRNYLADLGKYLEFINQLPQNITLDNILAADIVSQYVSYISDKNNSSRYLASLRKYCQFAIDQKIIYSDPFKEINKTNQTINLSSLVVDYESHLIKHNTPVSTVRNYINDLTQYINWLDTTKVESQ